MAVEFWQPQRLACCDALNIALGHIHTSRNALSVVATLSQSFSKRLAMTRTEAVTRTLTVTRVSMSGSPSAHITATARITPSNSITGTHSDSWSFSTTTSLTDEPTLSSSDTSTMTGSLSTTLRITGVPLVQLLRNRLGDDDQFCKPFGVVG